MPSKASSVHFLMFSCVWRSDFIAALLDPRFKKLKFKHDGMLQDRRRREALKWLSEAFNAKYKGKVKAADTSEGNAAGRAASTDAPPSAHRKRRKVSAAQFFANSDSEAESSDEEAAVKDELKEYLELPQIKYKSEQDAMLWWLEHQKQFPNLEVMARQYLGCPATSATVERLFSKVGIAFSAKRKRSEAATLESLMFTEANLPQNCTYGRACQGAYGCVGAVRRAPMVLMLAI